MRDQDWAWRITGGVQFVLFLSAAVVYAIEGRFVAAAVSAAFLCVSVALFASIAR